MNSLFSIKPEKNLIFHKEGIYQVSELQLTNQSQNYGAFKIKTNNSENYIIKPSIGVIGPGNNIKIDIRIIPSKQRSNDKIQVQGGIIMQQDDPINYFKSQQKFISLVLKCQQDGENSMISSVQSMKSTNSNTISSRINEPQDISQQIQQLSNEIKSIKESRSGNQFKTYAIIILISFLFGAFIAYR
ncbi:hypothetical protein pb186bvf_013982 [Paramecium bursaria]